LTSGEKMAAKWSDIMGAFPPGKLIREELEARGWNAPRSAGNRPMIRSLTPVDRQMADGVSSVPVESWRQFRNRPRWRSRQSNKPAFLRR
jgi:hypothetical protein